MRGCLSVLVLAIVFLAAGAWFAGPPVAAFVVETGLATAGFHGDDTQVTVRADPPFELLTAHADSVDIDSDDVTVDQFEAGHLRLSLTDADLLNRRFAEVEGRLDDVTVTTGGSSTLKATSVDLTGDPSEADMTIHVSREVLAQVALDTVSDELGVDASDVAFSAPDKMTLTSGGSTIAGQLVARDGGLSVVIGLPSNPRIDLIAATPGLRLTSVAIDDAGAMVLRGVLDVERLLS
jgi:hypothetical protein